MHLTERQFIWLVRGAVGLVLLGFLAGACWLTFSWLEHQDADTVLQSYLVVNSGILHGLLLSVGLFLIALRKMLWPDLSRETPEEKHIRQYYWKASLGGVFPGWQFD